MVRWHIALILCLALMGSPLGGEALAQKTTAPAKSSATTAPKTTSEKTDPKEAGTKPAETKSKSSDEEPTAKATTPVTKHKVQPVLMELSSSKSIYHAWDDIMVSAELWAIQPTTICFLPNRPEASFAVDLYRSGYGKVDLPPVVVQLSQQELQQMKRITLQPGQMHRILFNLKKVANMPPNFWKTGEYRIQTKFFLCSSGKADDETAISTKGPLHLLILD